MIWLVLSIVASAAIFVIFRMLPRIGAHTLPAIVINYVIAAVCGLLMTGNNYSLSDKIGAPWFIGGISVGVLFISLFYLMAFTAQRAGVGVTSIATKMSLVLPVAWFMATDPNDAPSVVKVAAVVLAVVGVVLSAAGREQGKFNWSYALYPAIIFVGSGIIDLVIGTFSNGNYFTEEGDAYLFTAAPFITSTVIGSVAVLAQRARGRQVMNFPTLVGGAVLGVVYFASILFLVRTFEAQLLDRSAIIPVNNLGVVLCSALASWWLFSERFSRRKLVGLVLSIVAIALLLYAG